MNKLLLVTVGALLVLGGQAYGNLLTNPGLEMGPDDQTADGWTTIEPDLDPNGVPVNTLQFQTAPWASHDSTRGAWYRPFMQNLANIASANARLEQSVPVTAGDDYTLSAWFKMEPFYSGLSPFEATQTILALEFLDAGDAVIGGAELDIDTVHPGDGEWYEYSVMATAPAGTMMARVSASMIDGVNTSGQQSMMADDFSLVPEPTSMLLVLPALALLRRR